MKNKSPFLIMEPELIAWILEMRKKNIAPKANHIRDKAKEIFGDPNFRASPGWFSRFCKRSNLTRRLPTHQVQKLKDDTWKEIVKFFENLRSERVEIERGISMEYEGCVFIKMDEVPLQFESVGHTYDFKGIREVSVLTNTNRKRRFTMTLAITSTGKALAPMLIFKGRTPISSALKTKYDRKAFLTTNASAWMTSELMRLWIDKILDNFPRSVDEVKKRGLDVHVMPVGCTGLMQPLDTCINKPLKDKLKVLYNSWLTDKAFKHTPIGYTLHLMITSSIGFFLEFS
jgi:hypothetical protein